MKIKLDGEKYLPKIMWVLLHEYVEEECHGVWNKIIKMGENIDPIIDSIANALIEEIKTF